MGTVQKKWERTPFVMQRKSCLLELVKNTWLLFSFYTLPSRWSQWWPGAGGARRYRRSSSTAPQTRVWLHFAESVGKTIPCGWLSGVRFGGRVCGIRKLAALWWEKRENHSKNKWIDLKFPPSARVHQVRKMFGGKLIRGKPFSLKMKI